MLRGAGSRATQAGALLPHRPGRARPPACSVRGVHFVIMGAGRVGTTLATTLTARGHSVAIIDQNPDSFRRLPEEFEGQIGRASCRERVWVAGGGVSGQKKRGRSEDWG